MVYRSYHPRLIPHLGVKVEASPGVVPYQDFKGFSGYLGEPPVVPSVIYVLGESLGWPG